MKRERGRKERSSKGWGSETECRVSRYVSETDCKNRNCKTCNCKPPLEWTNAGIVSNVSGRSVPSRPRLPAHFFLPWTSSNSSSKLSERPVHVLCHLERSFESTNYRERATGERISSSAPRHLDSGIFILIVWKFETRSDMREPDNFQKDEVLYITRSRIFKKVWSITFKKVVL